MSEFFFFQSLKRTVFSGQGSISDSVAVISSDWLAPTGGRIILDRQIIFCQEEKTSMGEDPEQLGCSSC